MGHIIFEFNNNKFRLERNDLEVEMIFENLTGVQIESKISDKKIEIQSVDGTISQSEASKRMKHPSVKDLIDLIKNQINFEFGTELIHETFYPDFNKQEWRKAYYSIYGKINNAMKLIEEQEKGNFSKYKEGKFTMFRFVKNNNTSLSEY